MSDKPTFYSLKSSTQEQRETSTQINQPKISQPYNPLNIEISPEESNPWTSPSLTVYANPNSNQATKAPSTSFFNSNQTNESLLPLYIRPVSTFFPISSATRKVTSLPIGLIISPGLVDQKSIPITDLTGSSLIRCPRCSANISPYCDISSDGRHWKCGICGNDTIFLTGNVHVKEKTSADIAQIHSPLDKKPKEIKTIADLYSQGSDINDSIISHEDRLEITSPVIDIIAPRNYNTHEKAGPSFLFIFDLSENSLIHYFAQTVASSILSIIGEISDDTYISLITISDNLTIYDFKKNNRTTYPELDPEILKDELSSHVCMLKDETGLCRKRFISALKEIQNLKIDTSNQKVNDFTQNIGNCFGSALEVVPDILKDIGGIVMAFIYGPCDVGPRAVSKRSPDEMVTERLLLRMPKTERSAFYGGIARLYARSLISLHLFAASDANGFVDLAVIGVPCGLTGGRCHSFRGFDPSKDISALHSEIYRTLTMKYLWDATIRLRTSNGLTIRRIHANCQLSTPNTISIPAVPIDDSFAYEFDVLMHVTTDTINFQLELEWNNEERKRMIRVINFSLPVSDDPLRILKHVDESALTTILMKRTISMILSEGAAEAAKIFQYEAKEITKVISASSSSASSRSELIMRNNLNIRLFPNFKCYPKMTFGLLNSSYLKPSFPNGPDGRFAQILQMRAIGIVDLILYVYPRLLTIDNEILPLSKDSIKKFMDNVTDINNCILIVHSCNNIFVWAKTKDALIRQLSDNNNIDVVGQSGIINLDMVTNQKLTSLIHSCWTISRKYLMSIAIFGENALDSLMVNNAITPNFNYSSWVQPFDMKV